MVVAFSSSFMEVMGDTVTETEMENVSMRLCWRQTKNLCVAGDFEDVVKEGEEGRDNMGKGVVICLEECLQEYGNFAQR